MLAGREGANGYSVNATYGAVEQAQQAMKQLNSYEMNNSQLRVSHAIWFNVLYKGLITSRRSVS